MGFFCVARRSFIVCASHSRARARNRRKEKSWMIISKLKRRTRLVVEDEKSGISVFDAIPSRYVFFFDASHHEKEGSLTIIVAAF